MFIASADEQSGLMLFCQPQAARFGIDPNSSALKLVYRRKADVELFACYWSFGAWSDPSMAGQLYWHGKVLPARQAFDTLFIAVRQDLPPTVRHLCLCQRRHQDLRSFPKV